MATQRDVVVVVGSLRKESFNRKTARVLMDLAPPALKMEMVEIRDLPLYDQDLDEATPPAPWTALRDRIRRCHAVLFVTPEYNRSVPGVLKNALDVASRPYGKSAWDGKPTAVVSVTPGALGAFGANHHLRQSFVFLNMPAMPAPECYIAHAGKLFDDQGALTNDSTREFLRQFMQAFGAWIERFAG